MARVILSQIGQTAIEDIPVREERYSHTTRGTSCTFLHTELKKKMGGDLPTQDKIPAFCCIWTVSK